MQDPMPRDYAAWRHCIEVDCGLSLTTPWIEQRIAALQDASDHHTRRFVELWGAEHRERVLAWFRRALEELQ